MYDSTVQATSNADVGHRVFKVFAPPDAVPCWDRSVTASSLHGALRAGHREAGTRRRESGTHLWEGSSREEDERSARAACVLCLQARLARL